MIRRSPSGHRIGDGHHNARLTGGDVRLIRALSADGLGYLTIARKFGVGASTVRDVVTYRTWRHA